MGVSRDRIGVVRLAWGDAREASVVPAGFLRGLGADQVSRHSALTPPRAARFLLGRWLMASLVNDITRDPVPPSEISAACRHCGGTDHGPAQTTAPAAISVSYADNIVAAAAVASEHATSVGIDIEVVPAGGPSAPQSELAALFAPSPPPSIREWTMIEASLKADGRGMRISPERLRFADRAPQHARKALPGGLIVHIDEADAGIIVAPAPAPPGFIVSVALGFGQAR